MPDKKGQRGLLGAFLAALGRKRNPRVVSRANRAATVDVDRFAEIARVGQDWAKSVYGDYYATSVPIYAAIKIRSEALARPRVVVTRQHEPVPESHPLQQLLDGANRRFTRGELWRATETYLGLWGSAFWALERDARGRWEIWPLRPDRVRILPEKSGYPRGYIYMGTLGPVAYTADEIVWLRYFNPLEEFAGLAPLPPLRLSADMGLDALRFNRNFFKNSAQPDVILSTEESMTDEEVEVEVEDFYERWERRYKGPGNAHRPAIASFIKDVKSLNGFSQREMEFVRGLRWSLEDVSRVYGVPLPLLSDYQQATFANINTAERLFWRNAMIPEIKFLEEQLNEKLLPRLGYADLHILFDLSEIEALQEDEDNRVARETRLLDRGVLTINEIRRQRNLPDVPWGDPPHFASRVRDEEARTSETADLRMEPEPTLLTSSRQWVHKASDNGH